MVEIKQAGVYWTTEECAVVLRVDSRTVQNYCRAGLMRHVQAGKRLTLVLSDDVKPDVRARAGKAGRRRKVATDGE